MYKDFNPLIARLAKFKFSSTSNTLNRYCIHSLMWMRITQDNPAGKVDACSSQRIKTPHQVDKMLQEDRYFLFAAPLL